MLHATIREPVRDVEAQIAALVDPAHPKDAVFLARSNSAYEAPSGVSIVKRADGTLLTTNDEKARLFASARDLTDEDMARLLGYPEAKSDIRGDHIMVQARTSAGAVVMEAATSAKRLLATMGAVNQQMPKGGSVAFLSPIDALIRRVRGI